MEIGKYIFEFDFTWIIGFGYIPQSKRSFVIVLPFLMIDVTKKREIVGVTFKKG